jgi:hypothetical protein
MTPFPDKNLKKDFNSLINIADTFNDLDISILFPRKDY